MTLKELFKDYLLHQRQEISLARDLLKKDGLREDDLEALKECLYQRRRFRALWRNLLSQGRGLSDPEREEIKETIDQILSLEEELRVLLEELRQRLLEKQRALKQGRKALRSYGAVGAKTFRFPSL